MRRSILITGCSSGFGRQLSEQLARNGDCVYATMRGTNDKNAKVASELRDLAAAENLKLVVLELDVTSADSVAAVANRVIEETGAPDVIVNNAGQMFIGITEAFTAEELSRQLDVNVVGVHRVNRAFLPAMRERGEGLIINISSIAGRLSAPFFGVYHASKWAVEGYSMALRGELASSGVDVVVVEPGPFATELFGSSPQPEGKDNVAASYPDIAHQTFQNMGSAFDQMFENAEMPTDPGAVVDLIAGLIDMQAGTRQFRNVAGIDFGVRERNAAAAPFDEAVLEDFGMTEFANFVAKKI